METAFEVFEAATAYSLYKIYKSLRVAVELDNSDRASPENPQLAK
jgi:hypothetical protein